MLGDCSKFKYQRKIRISQLKSYSVQGSGGKHSLKSPKQFLDNHFPNATAIYSRKLDLNVLSCKLKVNLLNNFHKKTICVSVCFAVDI